MEIVFNRHDSAASCRHHFDVRFVVWTGSGVLPAVCTVSQPVFPSAATQRVQHVRVGQFDCVLFDLARDHKNVFG